MTSREKSSSLATFQIHVERMRLLMMPCDLVRGRWSGIYKSTEARERCPCFQFINTEHTSTESLLKALKNPYTFTACEQKTDLVGHNMWHYVAVSGRVDFVTSDIAKCRSSWDVGDMPDGLSCVHLALLDRFVDRMFVHFLERPELKDKTLTLDALPLLPPKPNKTKIRGGDNTHSQRHMRPLRLNLLQLAVFVNKPLSFFLDANSGFMTQDAWSMEEMGNVFNLAIWGDCTNQLEKLIRFPSFLELLTCVSSCSALSRMSSLDFAVAWNRVACVKLLLSTGLFSKQAIECARQVGTLYQSHESLEML